MKMNYCINQPKGPQKRAAMVREMTGSLKERQTTLDEVELGKGDLRLLES